MQFTTYQQISHRVSGMLSDPELYCLTVTGFNIIECIITLNSVNQDQTPNKPRTCNLNDLCLLLSVVGGQLKLIIPFPHVDAFRRLSIRRLLTLLQQMEKFSTMTNSSIDLKTYTLSNEKFQQVCLDIYLQSHLLQIRCL